MPNLFLLSPGSLCAEQEREVEKKFKVRFITSLPTDLQKIWKKIKPAGDLDVKSLGMITGWLEDYACKDDFVLVQGDPGATVFIVEFCFDAGLIPIYETGRVICEKAGKDASSAEPKEIFKHVQFRKYEKWGE